MDDIKNIVNNDENLNKKIASEVIEYKKESDETKIAYGVQLIAKINKLEEALILAGKFMLDDEVEYRELMKELQQFKNDNEYLQNVIKEYKKQKGEINTDFIERKLCAGSLQEDKSEREQFNSYLNRKFNRLGLDRKNYKIVAIKKS